MATAAAMPRRVANMIGLQSSRAGTVDQKFWEILWYDLQCRDYWFLQQAAEAVLAWVRRSRLSRNHGSSRL